MASREPRYHPRKPRPIETSLTRGRTQPATSLPELLGILEGAEGACRNSGADFFGVALSLADLEGLVALLRKETGLA